MINPGDEEAFKRIINFPTRGIGATTVSKISSAARLHNTSMWEIVTNPLEYNLDVNSGTANKIAVFRELMESFSSQLSTLSAYDLATMIVKQSGIAADSYQDQTPEGMSRQENLQELLGGIHEFCETRREEGDTNISLPDFLSEVSLLTDQDTDKEADQEKVTMMTVHASKGLEFDYVFVVGLEEDLFPSAMAKNEFKGLEEERRLFYVAMTRAKEICVLSFAKSRFRNGQVNPCNPSRFLKDISTDYLKVNKSVLSGSLGGFSPPVAFNKISTDSKLNTTQQSDEKRTFRQPASGNFVPVDKVKIKAENRIDTSGLSVGNIIQHERFGIGKVIAISGDTDSRKATVEFENSGTKQLLLKFARFEILE